MKTKILKAALHLLKFRPRTEKEIANLLLKKGFSSDAVTDALIELSKSGHIDDRKFCRLWGESRKEKFYGLNRITAELKNKGIREDVVSAYARKLGYGYCQKEAVETLVKRRLAMIKDMSDPLLKRRLYSFLMRRGFEQEIVQDVLDRLCAVAVKETE